MGVPGALPRRAGRLLPRLLAGRHRMTGPIAAGKVMMRAGGVIGPRVRGVILPLVRRGRGRWRAKVGRGGPRLAGRGTGMGEGRAERLHRAGPVRRFRQLAESRLAVGGTAVRAGVLVGGALVVRTRAVRGQPDSATGPGRG